LLSSSLLVGTFLTTLVIPILTSGVKVKDAVSSLVLALLESLTSSAQVLLEPVLRPEEVAVHAPLILVLTIASGSILSKTMTAIILLLILMLDFPVSKALADLLELSASKVPSTIRMQDLKLLSASSTLAVEAAAVLSLPSMLVVSLLPVPRRVMSALVDMLVLSIAPTQLNIAALLVKRPVPVVAWVEVLAVMVSVLATRVTRVRIVPLLIKQEGK